LKIAFFGLLVLSSGQVFLFTPLVAYLWFVTRQSRYLYLLGIILPVTAINFLGNHSIGQKTGLLNYDHVFSAPKIIWEQGFIRFFFAPLLGSGLTEHLMQMPGLLFWPLSIGITSLFFHTLVKKTIASREQMITLTLAYLCCAASFGVIAITRSYAFGQVSRESGYVGWDGRYAFLTGALALVIWSSLFSKVVKSPFRMGSKKNRLVQAALLLIVFHHLGHFNTRNMRPDPEFDFKAAQLEAAIYTVKQRSTTLTLTTDPFLVGPEYYHHSQMTVLVHPDGSITSTGKNDPPR